jgi:antitoxin CptB
MRELDLLLARFVDEEHARASSDQRRAFDRLIALPDPELAAYLLGHERPADPELAAIADTVARRH